MNKGNGRAQKLRIKAQRAQDRNWLARLTVESVVEANANTPELTQLHHLKNVVRRLALMHSIDLAEDQIGWTAKSAQHLLSCLRTTGAEEMEKKIKRREFSAKCIFATSLRKNPTPAEQALREAFDRAGMKYMFQIVNKGYIPDFYFGGAKTIVEVDGPIHERQKEYDKHRDQVFLAAGIVTHRVTNDEVLSDPDAVALRLKAGIIERRRMLRTVKKRLKKRTRHAA